MSLKEVNTNERYVTKDIEECLDDKESEERLFNEYYNQHSKENTMNVSNECKQKSENDISKEIDS